MLAFLPLPLPAAPNADADRAWQVILQQADGPGTRFHNQEEAFAAARRHLDAQQASLREFLSLYPSDPRSSSARIRLSSVLAAKGQMIKQPSLIDEAQKILNDLETGPDTPLPVKADAGYARVSRLMEEASNRPMDDAARDEMLKTVRQFDATYSDDRRTAGLLTEVATLYDARPAEKRALLEEALARTKDAALRTRIGDDLKRIALLGRPLDVRLLPWQGGGPINTADERGRVVVLIFWASWSMPALHELARLKEVAREFVGQPVDFYGVALDEDRAALAATIKAADIRWPMHCDGRGWEGELVRTLGINALPTVWVLNRRGELLTLNARTDTADLIRAALTAP